MGHFEFAWSDPLSFMAPSDQIIGLLGEHFKNYVLIVQDYDHPHHFVMHKSDVFAASGLITEAHKELNAEIDAVADGAFEWVDWDLSDDDEETTDY